jgi:hypothetical protein
MNAPAQTTQAQPPKPGAPAPAAAPKPQRVLPAAVMINYKAQRLLVVHSKSAGELMSKLSAPDAVLNAEEVEALGNVGKPIHIIPGLHQYPGIVWDSIKDHPSIQALIRDEELVLVTKADLGQALKPGETAETEAAALPKSLAGVATGNAREVVDGVQDLKLLLAWQEDEKVNGKRQSVLDALFLQISKVRESDARFEAAAKSKQ